MSTFDINKSLAGAACLCSAAGGTISMFRMVKMLYWADRLSFERRYHAITGDSYASLKKGPIVSHLYDLIKHKKDTPDLDTWQEYFSYDKSTHQVTMLKTPELDYLSESEIEMISESFKTIAPLNKTQLEDLLHKLPEWQDPGCSSVPLSTRTILRKVCKLEDARIFEIEEEEDAAENLVATFGTI
jgi:uncharacterized phage-associated protein